MKSRESRTAVANVSPYDYLALVFVVLLAALAWVARVSDMPVPQ